MRDYFCHLAMMYPIVFPYLKGFHLTLANHLPGRDNEGRKRKELEYIASIELIRDKDILS